MLDLLAAAPTPAALRDLGLGLDGFGKVTPPRSPRLARTLPIQILAAFDAPTLVVPGTAAFAHVLTGVATRCARFPPNATTWPAISRPAWRPTLLERS